MLPTLQVQNALGELLAVDTTIPIAPAADANKIFLIMEEFVPSVDLEIGQVTPANFTGSTPKLVGLGAQLCAIDPTTLEQYITMKDPAGGWNWETTDAVNLPQTIFGYGMMNNDEDELFGTALLDAPITLTAAGQMVSIGTITYRFVAQPMS